MIVELNSRIAWCIVRDDSRNALGFPEGSLRSLLHTKRRPIHPPCRSGSVARNVTIHRASRWHSATFGVRLCSKERNDPPDKPVAFRISISSTNSPNTQNAMDNKPEGITCPVPDSGSGEQYTLSHGEGGRLMRRLIQQTLCRVSGTISGSARRCGRAPRHGSAAGDDNRQLCRLAAFLPGGDIGTLAVYGTVNDLAVSGVRPLWISLAMIIEEGSPLATLQRVLGASPPPRPAWECRS